MAKRRYAIDEARIAKKTKERHGRGNGPTYRPWLTIHEVPSEGRAHRNFSVKAQRIVHFLSDLENDVFLEFDDSALVKDIREQFPLERPETILIAERLGIAHPDDHGVDIVMTTDLLVDFVDGSQVAISCKMSSELGNPRVLEKLDIEREYWAARNVDWFIVTEREVSRSRRLNLQEIGEWRSLEGLDVPHDGYWDERRQSFMLEFADALPCRLGDFTRSVEVQYGWAAGEAITAMKQLLAAKLLQMDIDRRLDFDGPLSQLAITMATDAADPGSEISFQDEEQACS